ncbi:MAG: D-alanine--D-alanine ligase family protein [Candidatus Paceibacterota bacterium]
MKKKVLILYGGQSAEHEISILSTQNIIAALDTKKYAPTAVYISKQGDFLKTDQKTLKPTKEKLAFTSGGRLIFEKTGKQYLKIDVALPVLHGPNGEDGKLQGMLDMVQIPYVGAKVLASAVGMDKEVMKRLLEDSNIPVAPYLVSRKNSPVAYKEAAKKLGKTLYVKPANMGSSVGVSRVENQKAYSKALQEAFKYDTKVLIEKEMKGRELEVAILADKAKPVVSVPGEVITPGKFYSYKEKYSAKSKTTTQIPAKLTAKQTKVAKEVALKTFYALESRVMARIDLFLVGEKIYVNEVNTIPGFTNISMYPKLLQHEGISYTDLISRLIESATL